MAVLQPLQCTSVDTFAGLPIVWMVSLLSEFRTAGARRRQDIGIFFFKAARRTNLGLINALQGRNEIAQAGVCFRFIGRVRGDLRDPADCVRSPCLGFCRYGIVASSGACNCGQFGLFRGRCGRLVDGLGLAAMSVVTVTGRVGGGGACQPWPRKLRRAAALMPASLHSRAQTAAEPTCRQNQHLRFGTAFLPNSGSLFTLAAAALKAGIGIQARFISNEFETV
ncbi:hypothetical protein [Mesorhizobium sp. WSM2239]|uniref:Uncharacterized protein n=2 Tax=unclassified Mesorhizobium TaxID=325217 RepID=A0AAU8DFX4_9HYPH